MKLAVKVNEEFSLDAGSVKVVSEADGVMRVVTPPAITMFDQLLAYLDSKPLPEGASSVTSSTEEGVVAAALCLRWGSYFAVLADQSKPRWAVARNKETRETVSRISDAEMARINIESSAAMAALVDIYRDSTQPKRYAELVAKAKVWLPMPQRKVSARKPGFFYALSAPYIRQQMLDVLTPDEVARARAVVASNPSRVFGNALVNYGWRNGPIEDIHAGECPNDLPLDQCRISSTELRDLMRNSASSFQEGFNACLSLHVERAASWPDQVLPYNLAQTIAITPSKWTMDESIREVQDWFPN